jgi:hypothetical protein
VSAKAVASRVMPSAPSPHPPIHKMLPNLSSSRCVSTHTGPRDFFVYETKLGPNRAVVISSGTEEEMLASEFQHFSATALVVYTFLRDCIGRV